jgi:tight adherence protein C
MVVVAAGLAGVWSMVSALPRFRRPRLARRLAPYLGALGPRRSLLLAEDEPGAGVAGVLRPLVTALAARLQSLLGDDGRELGERIAASGRSQSTSAFRSEQVVWGLAGVLAGIGVSVVLVGAGRPVSPLVAVMLAVAFAGIGVVARDRALTRAVARRRQQARAEFPTVVDMVCVAVTAGESLRSALELVARDGAGPLAAELRGALRAARAGTTMAAALEQAAQRLGLPAFDRFVGAVVAAQERGISLGDALRAMAFDVREGEKRDVIEAAGRKQVSMLVPVVGLILPVAIVFAFYPGVVAIRTLAR